MAKAADVDTQSTTTTLVDDPTRSFTATGRPMPAQDVSALGNMNFGFVGQNPQSVPTKFNDDSLIMVPVPIEDDEAQEGEKSRRRSIAEKFGLKKKKDKFKMVEMTRAEYQAKYAKDENGNPIRKPENE